MNVVSLIEQYTNNFALFEAKSCSKSVLVYSVSIQYRNKTLHMNWTYTLLVIFLILEIFLKHLHATIKLAF